MAKRDKTHILLESIDNVTDLQLKALKTFENRFETLKEHKTLVVNELLPRSRKLRKSKDEDTLMKNKSEILEVIATIGVRIHSNFSEIVQNLKDLKTSSELSEDNNEAIEKVFSDEIVAARKAALNPNMNNTEVQERLEEFTSNFIEALKKESEISSMEKYLLNIFKILQGIIERERNLLQREFQIFEVYKFTEWNEHTISRIKDAEALLVRTIKELDELLRTEKREVMEPLSKILKEKQSLNNQVKKLISEKKGLVKKQNVITIKDLKEDIRRLVRSEDVSRYLTALAPLYSHLDSRAQTFYGKVATVAARTAKGERIDLNKKAEEAIIDKDLGVYNKGYYSEFIEVRVEESYRYKQPFSILILDIDNFKSFNSSYELSGGDVILKYFAKFFKDNLRPTDYIFRFGGEEFAIIFTQTKLEDALKAAERFRKKLFEQSETLMTTMNSEAKLQSVEEREPWDIIKAESDKEFRIQHITFSAGLVSYSPPPERRPDFNAKEISRGLTEAAGELMKKAKKAGRNRILH